MACGKYRGKLPINTMSSLFQNTITLLGDVVRNTVISRGKSALRARKHTQTGWEGIIFIWRCEARELILRLCLLGGMSLRAFTVQERFKEKQHSVFAFELHTLRV